MKKTLILFMTVLLSLGFVNLNLASNLPPGKGGVLPPINLPISKESAEKGYLGLTGQGFSKVQQIRAKIVIIEIFSLYCPACVKLAPVVKELYQIIENHPELKGKIKLIGIGAGNTLYEVNTFKIITETPFPLFPDKDFDIHAALGGVRTPYFIGIKINDNGTHEVIYSELGGFKEAQEFLELIISVSGLE